MGFQTKVTTEAVMDGILKFIAAGGMLTTATIAPNAVQIFDKPLMKLLKQLDERQRHRELLRITHYMKQRGLISYNPRDYEHGIKLTKNGKNKLRQRDFSTMAIPRPHKWDKKWRLVFFDIPESYKHKRNSLNLKLKQLGFRQLQISIWVYPFPCRSEIEAVSETLDIRKFVTYVEINKIDNEKLLKDRFKFILASKS